MKYLSGFLLLLLLACQSQNKQENEEKTFSNPLFEKGADPWITLVDGVYYYCYSRGGSIRIRSAEDITRLPQSDERIIWTPEPDTDHSKELWAPELHKMGDHWYVYVAADDGDNFNHRMQILRSETADINSTFAYVGELATPQDKWAIDGTVMPLHDKLYFVWSGWEGDENVAQNLYIAEMAFPTDISSDRVLISKPDQEWEQRGSGNGLPTINEGPQILKHEDKTFIIYSASGSWSDFYCLGSLELTGDDPMDPDNWKKSDGPVFEGTEDVISPGHCSFTTVGDQDWIVYHAVGFKGGGWDNRYVKMQPFDWKNGRPDFGKPISDGVPISLP